jgi:hypothetical protein
MVTGLHVYYMHIHHYFSMYSYLQKKFAEYSPQELMCLAHQEVTSSDHHVLCRLLGVRPGVCTMRTSQSTPCS